MRVNSPPIAADTVAKSVGVLIRSEKNAAADTKRKTATAPPKEAKATYMLYGEGFSSSSPVGVLGGGGGGGGGGGSGGGGGGGDVLSEMLMTFGLLWRGNPRWWELCITSPPLLTKPDESAMNSSDAAII